MISSVSITGNQERPHDVATSPILSLSMYKVGLEGNVELPNLTVFSIRQVYDKLESTRFP